MITRLEQRMILLKLNQKRVRMMIRFLYLKTNFKKVDTVSFIYIIHRAKAKVEIMILINLYLHTHIHIEHVSNKIYIIYVFYTFDKEYIFILLFD